MVYLILNGTSLAINVYDENICLQTKLYKEDWIGLKTLDEAGKVKFINVSGNHLQISESDMKKYVAPYLEEEAPAPAPAEQTVTESSSYILMNGHGFEDTSTYSRI